MNESDFEAQLRADGYTEIETQNLGACRTHETNGQILKQMESTSGFSATKFLHAGNLDSFVSPFG